MKRVVVVIVVDCIRCPSPSHADYANAFPVEQCLSGELQDQLDLGGWGWGALKSPHLIASLCPTREICASPKKNLINFTGRYNHSYRRTLHFMFGTRALAADLYYFLSKFCTAYSNRTFIMQSPISLPLQMAVSSGERRWCIIV